MPPADVQAKVAAVMADPSLPVGSKVVVRSADPPAGTGKRYVICVTNTHPRVVRDPSAPPPKRACSAYVQNP